MAVEHLRNAPYNAADDHLRAITLEIVATLKELLHLHPLYNEQLRSFAAFGGDFHDLSRLADMGASLTSADEAALQAVLEELTVPAKCAPSSVTAHAACACSIHTSHPAAPPRSLCRGRCMSMQGGWLQSRVRCVRMCLLRAGRTQCCCC